MPEPTLAAWVLSAMTTIQPDAPWRDTYDASAEVIADVSENAPLFDGPDGPRRTAALLVSLGWFESSLRPDAKGDCDERKSNGTCAPGGRPRSFCMFQLHESNLRALGTTREDLLTSTVTCARSAVTMLRTSLRVCRGRPLDDRLAHYAAGGEGCREQGVAKSRHRMRKARWLSENVR